MKKDQGDEVSSEGVVSSKGKKCCGMSYKFWGGVIIVVVIIIAGYYAWGALKPKPSQTEAQKAAEQQVLAIVARVKKLMVVPDGEVPQVAEIKDAALAAKEQPFLAGSQNGDVLLVYATAGKAIVYSPARNVIVNVGPVQMNKADASAQTPAPAPVTSDNTATTKKK